MGCCIASNELAALRALGEKVEILHEAELTKGMGASRCDGVDQVSSAEIAEDQRMEFHYFWFAGLGLLHFEMCS